MNNLDGIPALTQRLCRALLALAGKDESEDEMSRCRRYEQGQAALKELSEAIDLYPLSSIRVLRY